MRKAQRSDLTRSGKLPTPPVPAAAARPEPVAEPAQQPAQPIQAAEDLEYTATEVEDHSVSTFAAAQRKSMTALWSAIDQMKQDMAETAEKQTRAVEIRIATAETAGVVLTAAVVAWILRGGALFSSLISTIPLWKGYDPLPILAYEDDTERNQAAEIDEDTIPTSTDDLKKLKALMQQKEQAANKVDVDSLFGGSAPTER